MSNVLGTIKGNVKHGKSSILINSNTVEISGNLSANGRIDFFSSNEELAASDATGILSKIDNLDNSLNSLLTSNNDASFNNVDISGSLNVQGQKVMSVPSLDICGNDLSANTTYEITTGPSGNINNISFVKKQQAFIAFSGTGKTFTWGQSVPQNYTIGSGGGSTITIDQISRNGTATLQQSNLTYNANGSNLGIFRIDVDGLYQINAVWTFAYNEGGGLPSGHENRGERQVVATIRLNGSRIIQNGTFIIRQDANITRVTMTQCHVAMLTEGDTLSFYFDGSHSGSGAYAASVDYMSGSILLVR